MVKMRLARRGRKKLALYDIVVANSRSPRDGRFIEKLGTYNPNSNPATIEFDENKAFDWLMKGAQPTDTVRAILRFKGVYFRKHLMRGVAKGAMTLEDAMAKYQEWIDSKEAKTAARAEKTKAAKAEFYANLSGVAKAKPIAPVVEEVVEEVAEAAEEAVEETAPEVEAAAEETTSEDSAE